LSYNKTYLIVLIDILKGFKNIDPNSNILNVLIDFMYLCLAIHLGGFLQIISLQSRLVFM